MGLFEKKYCDVCGEKIKLLGNKKLEDANLCKNCASKLSPWFTGRRHTTLDDIKGQLAYREENEQAVSAFNATRTIGRNYKVYLDENAKKFFVTNSNKYREENPDVLDFSQVTGVDIDIDEDQTEKFHTNSQGESVSYSPPRFEYDYDFFVIIHVNHPYIEQMRFKLNSSSVRTGEVRANGGMNQGMNMNMNSGNSAVDAMGNMMGSIAAAFAAGAGGALPPDYMEYINMANEIKNVLMGARQDAMNAAAEAAKPKVAKICPNCGASCIPDANGCCEFCGGAMG